MKDYSKESLEGVFQLEKADYKEETNSIDKNSSNFMKAVSVACNVLEEKSKINDFETLGLQIWISRFCSLSNNISCSLQTLCNANVFKTYGIQA